MPTKLEREKAKLYLDKFNEKCFTLGRLGLYNYRYDIDDAIEQSLKIINEKI